MEGVCPVAWPAKSPGLTPLNFFLWGCMKEKVYKMEIASREVLIGKINTTAMEILHCRLGNVSERSDGALKHVFVREVDILSICSSQPLELVGAIRDTEQLTKHIQLNTELSDKMAVESSEERYVLCSRNSELRTNSEKVY